MICLLLSLGLYRSRTCTQLQWPMLTNSYHFSMWKNCQICNYAAPKSPNAVSIRYWPVTKLSRLSHLDWLPKSRLLALFIVSIVNHLSYALLHWLVSRFTVFIFESYVFQWIPLHVFARTTGEDTTANRAQCCLRSPASMGRNHIECLHGEPSVGSPNSLLWYIHVRSPANSALPLKWWWHGGVIVRYRVAVDVGSAWNMCCKLRQSDIHTLYLLLELLVYSFVLHLLFY